MDLGLKGKIAAITGGSEGIGKATAMLLAEEGAKVAICARRKDVLEAAAEEIREKTDGDVLTVSCDVTQPGQVEHFVQQALGTWGGIDILVNNVGTSFATSFESVTDEGWQADLDLKLYSAIRASRVAIPSMRARGGGRIINVLNIGSKAPGPNSVPTSVSRAAGLALTKALSKELAKDNILVNAICIGLIKSGQTSRGATRRYPNLSLDAAFKEMGARNPLGRIGEAEEAASVIAFLASERGSFVTGSAINVDGGASAVV
jgi:NAD(P)-dependent dehydrogenase (short-subunit alcohol dehydrogenase family)